MKLLRHEYILGIITLIFLLFIFFLPAGTQNENTVAVGSDKSAVPYLIDINAADATELALLDGIGPKLAERIIAYRTEHGGFESISELCEVPGIGTSVLEDISDYIKA